MAQVFLRRFEWSRPAFLIGFVLSSQIELYTNQAFQIASHRFPSSMGPICRLQTRIRVRRAAFCGCRLLHLRCLVRDMSSSGHYGRQRALHKRWC